MRTVYLKPGPFGLEYKTIPGSLWKSLPTELRTQEDVKRYFMEGRDQPTRGKFDPPELSFVDANMKPVTYYNVSKGGRINTNFDPSKTLSPDPDHFWPTSEQIEYLRAWADDNTVEQGKKLETEREERDFLLRKARTDTAMNFQIFVREGMTTETVEKFCSDHAKEHNNSGSVVIFE